MPDIHPPAYLSPTKVLLLPKLSSFQASHFVKIRCDWCRITHFYEPADLITIFGDVPMMGVEQRFRCTECGKKSYLSAKPISIGAPEAIRITVRRLVCIKTLRRPVWEDVKR